MKKIIILILLSVSTLVSKEQFGGFSISKTLYNYIVQTLATSPSKIVLELGSGWGSGKLSESITVYSVEHDKKYLNRYPTHYIYAPIVKGWYDIQVLQKELPSHYDLLLVDGPPGYIGRQGFLENLDLFNRDIPIIIDDVHREAEFMLLQNVALALGRSYTIFTDENGESQFGVIVP